MLFFMVLIVIAKLGGPIYTLAQTCERTIVSFGYFNKELGIPGTRQLTNAVIV